MHALFTRREDASSAVAGYSPSVEAGAAAPSGDAGGGGDAQPDMQEMNVESHAQGAAGSCPVTKHRISLRPMLTDHRMVPRVVAGRPPVDPDMRRG